MRIEYKQGYGTKKMYVDVIEKDGQYFGKWSFSENYTPIEVTEMEYHHIVGNEIDKTFTFGGWRFWFKDAVA